MRLTQLIRHWRAERLTKRGYGFIRSGAFDQALLVALELRKLKYTSAFELEALAHAGQGDLDRAIAVLKDGVLTAPTTWINWQLLGNYLSDQGLYEEAEGAYQHALACPDAWTSSIHLNRAITAERREDYSGALDVLSKVDQLQPEMMVLAVGVRVRALWKSGRLSEAEKVGAAFLQTDPELGDRRAWGLLAADVAKLRLELGHDRGAIATFVAQACREARECPEIVDLANSLVNVDRRV